MCASELHERLDPSLGAPAQIAPSRDRRVTVALPPPSPGHLPRFETGQAAASQQAVGALSAAIRTDRPLDHRSRREVGSTDIFLKRGEQ